MRHPAKVVIKPSVCHPDPEWSEEEESALDHFGPELRILPLRSTKGQNDSDFHHHGWAAGT
jgi:hypothetical protein